MTDRELLELAAKAAGKDIDLSRYDEDWGFAILHMAKWWNPLTDDGDALRLALHLRINIEHVETSSRKPHGVNCWPVGRGDCSKFETALPDYNAATRRAIVRAAAELGKEMK